MIFWSGQSKSSDFQEENIRNVWVSMTFREGRTWAIAVRRGSYESLFLLNSGRFSLTK